ncbi:nicotinate phosphoribosyltransferase [Deinococcus aquiradiocola]|uniref:Nicotinate phosphoribosyltransferase n=1 Tax=Deinococcus aquiradiocola TaxID=393059 RepID=A0A917PG37_9DEIO|nr:nicotinate phosphoribosyltransferase [Deinococcus aquiradiocola]GGJ75591.1 nicotinate phosphoribosyltransferase [Deinococcus aquiradiocola]
MSSPAASAPVHNHLSPLLTDLYQLTMLHGYWRNGMHAQTAVFDVYYRRNPYEGGYGVWAGLEPMLEYVLGLHFDEGALRYLAGLDLFETAFLDALRGWRFTGRIESFPEGSVVFPHEPLLTVTAPLWEAQLIETALLNTLNFQTLIATKAARCVSVMDGGTLVEFGTRRAQGPDGALGAARAAFIGGAAATSNVLAGQLYGLPVVGTHAHAWVESFPDELTAFRAYADLHPDSTTLLLDTVSTLESGLPNAITVARELRARGHELRAVRLDSGDLAYLSRRVRAALDAAGFPEVKVMASNDLSENVIQSVIREGGRLDIYAVGTQLVTGGGPGGGALGGVYKLAELGGQPRLKLTGDPSKTSLPGAKRVWRGTGTDGEQAGQYGWDVIGLAGDPAAPRAGQRVSDPANPLKSSRLPANLDWHDPRTVFVEGGERVTPPSTLPQVQARARTELRRLPEGTLRLLNPHTYRVSLTAPLQASRDALIAALQGQDVPAPTPGPDGTPGT